MSEQKVDSIDGIVTDVVVVGAGIAGLAVAIKLGEAFPSRTICLLSKDNPGVSNSYYAQGGIAVVVDNLNDSIDQHISDTLRAGDGACDGQVVQMVIQEAPDRLKELISWGASFDHEPMGNLALGLEGGHSAKRIVHHRDNTGGEIIKTLLARINRLPNILTQWNTLVLDLVVQDGKHGKQCTGVQFIGKEDNTPKTIVASCTVLATGGVGQVFKTTTNPAIATGDGIAIAWRAGADIRDMHLVQFHPTALNVQTAETAFLISEAVRGFGAHVCTKNGKRFLFQYDGRGELAPRDIVARAIDEQSKSEEVYLDCRHLPKEALMHEFPMIYFTCLSHGIDITTDLIPITPAAHYLCGGIATDKHARTSINNLYAIGECASTGLHGANRLASNSLLEALVFAHHCYLDIGEKLNNKIVPILKPFNWVAPLGPPLQELTVFQYRLKQIMGTATGIIRTNYTLATGLVDVMHLQKELSSGNEDATSVWKFYETKNMIAVARLILEHSFSQTRNRGVFYNKDLAGTMVTGIIL